MAENNTENLTSKQVNPPNPTGKGGFGDNPQNINRDGRPKNEQRFGYWLQFFKNLTSKEFTEYTRDRPQDDMYVAEVIAYERVKNARKDLKEYQDVADRTEGKARQALDISGSMRLEQLIQEITDENPESQEDTESN